MSGKVIQLFHDRNAVAKPADKHFSFVKLQFEPGYDAHVRSLTAGDGNLPQDKLIYAFVTMNPVTGCASEFGWASGRKDMWAVVDITPEALIFHNGLEKANQIINDRRAFIEALKEQYYEQGFEHGGSGQPDEYEGGFENFARNFERATGRRVAAVVDGLCRSQLRKTA